MSSYTKYLINLKLYRPKMLILFSSGLLMAAQNALPLLRGSATCVHHLLNTVGLKCLAGKKEPNYLAATV